MLDRLLNNVNTLEKGLDAVWLNNDAIAGNIANADTPGYKAQSVDFRSVFQEALDTRATQGSTANAQPAYQAFLNEKGSSSAIAASSLDVGVQRNMDTTIRMDQNNVDVDQQMAELAKNSILYEALTYSVSRELGRIKLVISEGK